jgi:hypothetical protein
MDSRQGLRRRRGSSRAGVGVRGGSGAGEHSVGDTGRRTPANTAGGRAAIAPVMRPLGGVGEPFVSAGPITAQATERLRALRHPVPLAPGHLCYIDLNGPLFLGSNKPCAQLARSVRIARFADATSQALDYFALVGGELGSSVVAPHPRHPVASVPAGGSGDSWRRGPIAQGIGGRRWRRCENDLDRHPRNLTTV